MTPIRRTYAKPAIDAVKLMPSEAVLGICKSTNGGGQNSAPNACSTVQLIMCMDQNGS